MSSPAIAAVVGTKSDSHSSRSSSSKKLMVDLARDAQLHLFDKVFDLAVHFLLDKGVSGHVYKHGGVVGSLATRLPGRARKDKRVDGGAQGWRQRVLTHVGRGVVLGMLSDGIQPWMPSSLAWSLKMRVRGKPERPSRVCRPNTRAGPT